MYLLLEVSVQPLVNYREQWEHDTRISGISEVCQASGCVRFGTSRKRRSCCLPVTVVQVSTVLSSSEYSDESLLIFKCIILRKMCEDNAVGNSIFLVNICLLETELKTAPFWQPKASGFGHRLPFFARLDPAVSVPQPK